MPEAKRCPVCKVPSGDGPYCKACGWQLRFVAKEPAVPSADDLYAGTILEKRYRIKTRIGEGHTALVLEAAELVTGRPVALRLVHPELTKDPRFVEHLHRMFTLNAQLRHDRILAPLDGGQARDGTLFVVTELAGAPSLDVVVERDGPLPWNRVVEILVQLCDAFAAAHAVGVLGRGLTPGKVYLSSGPGGEPDPAAPSTPYREPAMGLRDVARIDLSLRRPPANVPSDHALQGQWLGRFEYIAPEAIDLPTTGAASDIYALGALAVMMATGRPPFADRSLLERIVAHHRRTEILPPSFDRVVPTTAHTVIARCLDPDPARRYAEMTDLRAALTAS